MKDYENKCSVDWCERLSEHIGFCGAHYQRHRSGRNMDDPIMNTGKVVHGRYSNYPNQVCKCDECANAWNFYRRDKRARARPPAFIAESDEHGEHRTYTKLKCRCQLCRFENARLARERKEIKKNPKNLQRINLAKICEICKKENPKLVVDHDHDTGEFRGMLCTSCNTGLGKLGDSAERLIMALEYLNKPRR